MSEVEGVPQEKLDMLWKHMLVVERKIGELSEQNIAPYCFCPIVNFAPQKDRDGYLYTKSDCGCLYYYEEPYYSPSPFNSYEIHDNSDTAWWDKLPLEHKESISEWLQNKVSIP